MVHLAGCLFEIGVIEDVVPRFHAAGFVPGYFHANTLINPGEAHIADGRSAEVVKEQRGTWAANIPSFGLQIVGTDWGPSAGYFEFCALLEGIRAVVRVDHTTRPLHLHTDSDYVIGALRFLPSKTGLPAEEFRQHPQRILSSHSVARYTPCTVESGRYEGSASQDLP